MMNASSSCSRSWNPRHTWKFFGGLAVILMSSGCATPDFTPIKDPKVRVEADGFSVLPPPGSGWYRTPDLHLQGTDGVGFAKRASTETHTIAISVARHKGFDPAAVGFPNYASNPAQFAAYVEASTRQMNPAGGRMRTLELSTTPNTQLGYGAKTHAKFEDQGSSPKGLIQEDWSYTYLHPDSSRVLIQVTISERGRPGEKDPAAATIWEIFRKGFEFRPLR